MIPILDTQQHSLVLTTIKSKMKYNNTQIIWCSTAMNNWQATQLLRLVSMN